MKPLNQLEVQLICEWLHDELIGAQLQDVWAFADGIVLHFYFRQDLFVVVYAKKSAPFVGLFKEKSPISRQTQKKPLSLFLASHGKNLFVRSVEHKAEYGRVFEIHLASKGPRRDGSKTLVIQLHLIPHRSNIVVQLYQGSTNKKISTQSYAVADYASDMGLTNEIFWDKPHPMEEREAVLPEGLETRSLPELHRQWKEDFRPQGVKSVKLTEAAYQQQKQKSLTKKTDAAESIQMDLRQLTVPYAEWGKVLMRAQYEDDISLAKPSDTVSGLEDFLVRQEIELPRKEDFLRWIRVNAGQKTWPELIEAAYEENKNQTRKITGLQERLLGLHDEILTLKTQTYQDFLNSSAAKQKPQRQIEAVKARKFSLPSGAVAYLGKSAQDNMKILRAAKSWDYWMHLRDMPGAHAIIHRDRQQNIADEEIRQVARWVIQESVKSKQKLEGQKFEVILTECRFVKPIKGDRLGRVNFSNEKNFIYYFRSDV